MKGEWGDEAKGMNRREFVRMALMSSALAASANGLAQASEGPEVEPAEVPYFGELRALPPGAVRPEGWLRTYLERQAAELGSQLPKVSWPFTDDYWGTEQQGESWWPWEQKAYWIDGATRLALVLDDAQLLAETGKPIRYTLSHIDTDGYIGPWFFEDPIGDFHRWPQNVFFRGLSALADAGAPLGGLKPKEIALAMQRHYLNDKADYGKPVRNVTNLEDMLWCYERTRDPALLALAERSWTEYKTIAGEPGGTDLSEMRVYAATPIDSHGVSYAETAKQPAILYLYTGKKNYLKFAHAAQRRIFDHHMLIDGVPSTTEFFRTVTSLDSHETCDIADHTWSWGYMLMATGRGIWADRVERACFNAGPGAIKSDWKGLQYFSCPNQFLATLDSDHNVMSHGGRMMAYQPNPGQKTACCGGNVHRIYPNYAIRMWMKRADGGLAAVLYGPSRLKTTAGAAQTPVEIVQETGYPFEEQIRFRIEAEQAVSFPLALRIPGWCAEPRIAVNGVSVAAKANAKGFVVLRRNFAPGDRITLTLPMRIALSRWPQQGIGLERGPIVYALPIQATWTSKVERHFTTAQFPSLEARPASAWNYALAVDGATLGDAVKVKNVPVSEAQKLDPWRYPSIALTVPARRIEGWELQANPGNPEQKFTPCLPEMSEATVSETSETVTLVPYGSTQLRMAIFPVVKA
ncbi:MAG TPA: beta-L-arabinofuranosidase domain-containing protein [Terracidiphilus sp.]|nr:beta-L-arabinofuranosidase domain-containing protein [Terracidiphilus sp.]